MTMMATTPNRFVKWLGASCPAVLTVIQKGTGALVTIAEKLDAAVTTSDAATVARQALAAPVGQVDQASQTAQVLYPGQTAVVLGKNRAYSNFDGYIVETRIVYRVDDPAELASLAAIKSKIDKVDAPKMAADSAPAEPPIPPFQPHDRNAGMP